MRLIGRHISSSWFISFAWLGACAPETPLAVDTDTTESELTASGGTVWVKEVDGPNWQLVSAVAAGPSSDVYVAGWWQQELWWDGATLAERDAFWEAPFIARLSPINGRPVWIKAPTEVGTSRQIVLGSEPSGDLVAAGRVSGSDGVNTMDLGCGRMYVQDFFARFDADGNCLAMNTMDLAEPRGFDILGAAPLTDGGMVIVGTLYGRAVLPDGSEVAPPPGYSVLRGAPMVVAFDADAETVRFVHVFQPASGELSSRGAGDATAVAVDGDGRVHVAGSLYQPSTVDGVALTPPAGARSSAFVVVFDDDGDVVRSGVFGENATANAIAVAPDGTTVLGGTFTRTIAFPGGISDSTPGDSPDGFVVKLAPDGNARWMRHLWGSAVDIAVTGVSIDVNGFVGVAGNFREGSLHVHPDVHMNGSDLNHVFVARLGTNTGSTVWSRTFTSGGGINAHGLAATTNRRLTVAGGFSGITYFSDRGPLFGDNLTGFVARMMP